MTKLACVPLCLALACTADVDGWQLQSSDVDLRGRLEVVIADHEDGHAITTYYLIDEETGERVELDTTQDLMVHVAHARRGAPATATGRLEDGILHEARVALIDAPRLAAATTSSNIGEQRSVVLLVNYRNDTRQPITVDQARDLVFGQISGFFREASYGQTWLSGDVFGWLTVDQDAGCTNCGGDDPLKAAVAAAGVNLASYARIVVIRPALAPYKNGIAGVSGCALSGAGQSCADNYVTTASVIAHELGHNFGLPHAGYLDCGQASLGVCLDAEYADQFDTMGAGKAWMGHFNAALKETIGWLGTAATPSVQTVTTSGTYTIGPLETAGALPRGLKVQKDVDAAGAPLWYSIELREPIGFDTFLSRYPFPNKPMVIVRLYSLQTWSSKIVQMRPDTGDPLLATSSTGLGQFNPGLQVGDRYVDRHAGISFELVSADAAQASVKVSYGHPPTLRGATSAAITAPGTTVQLSATTSVTDAAVTSVEFKLGATVLCTTTAAPYTCTWTVPNAPNTVYDIHATATDTRGLRSETATLRVSTDATPPTFTIASPTDGAAVTPGTYVTVQAASMLDNVKVDHVDVRANGTRVCHSVYASCNWLVPASPPDATWTLQVVVFDTSGNATTRSVTVKAGAGGAASLVEPTATMTFPASDTTLPGYQRMGVRLSAQLSSAQATGRFYANGSFVGATYRADATGNTQFGGLFTPTFIAAPVGTEFSLTARAVDASGVAGSLSAPVTLTVAPPTPPADIYAPSIAFVTPTNGTTVRRGSTVTLTATASDNVGVTKVELSINGNLACSDTTAPYTCAWPVPKGKSRTFILQARAFDAAGNTSAAQISVASI